MVIGCNFCPFAAREVKRDTIGYVVVERGDPKNGLEALATAFASLDEDEGIETMLIIFPDAFVSFDAYLQLVELSEKFLEKQGYEGIYQLATFHPLYLFAGAGKNDPANYTNRSPYPMLHLLREESLTAAIDRYPDTNTIPEKNIEYAQQKGLAAMEALRKASMKVSED